MLLLVGCGKDDEGGDARGRALTAGDATILVGNASEIGMDALLQGRLAVVDGCLGVEDAVVVWPKGSQVVDDDPVTVDVPGYGKLVVGDDVKIGGGTVAVPTRDRGGDDLEVLGVRVPAGCAGHEVWGAG